MNCTSVALCSVILVVVASAAFEVRAEEDGGFTAISLFGGCALLAGEAENVVGTKEATERVAVSCMHYMKGFVDMAGAVRVVLEDDTPEPIRFCLSPDSHAGDWARAVVRYAEKDRDALKESALSARMIEASVYHFQAWNNVHLKAIA